MITLLQHTHPNLPHYGDKEWDWLRGAMATVGLSLVADTHARSMQPGPGSLQEGGVSSATLSDAAVRAGVYE